MTVIKINAITVPAESGDELAKRFAARAGAVDGQEGFEGFELLRPADERTQWLVVTRWRDEESFKAWVASPAFAEGHKQERQAAADGGGAHKHEGGAHGHGERPVGSNSELWSYTIAGGSPGKS